MRITIHLDTFDSTDPAVYAILWLDNEARKWSREGHAGMHLPEWGNLATTDGTTRIADPATERVLCELEGLDLGAANGPFEGETGRVLWHRHSHHPAVSGHWHVQCVDEMKTAPESGLFAGPI